MSKVGDFGSGPASILSSICLKHFSLTWVVSSILFSRDPRACVFVRIWVIICSTCSRFATFANPSLSIARNSSADGGLGLMPVWVPPCYCLVGPLRPQKPAGCCKILGVFGLPLFPTAAPLDAISFPWGSVRSLLRWGWWLVFSLVDPPSSAVVPISFSFPLPTRVARSLLSGLLCFVLFLFCSSQSLPASVLPANPFTFHQSELGRQAGRSGQYD